jgi:hypothetical protein
VVVNGLAGEQPAEHRHALAKDRHPASHRHTDGRVLFGAAAEGDAERQPPAREMLERGHLTREHGGIAQREDEHRGAELDAPYARCGRGEEHQRVEHVRPVEDAVLGPDRVEAERLDLAEELRVRLARAQRADRGARHMNADRDRWGQRDLGPKGSGRNPPSRASRNAFSPPCCIAAISSARWALYEACAMLDSGMFISMPAPSPIARRP